MLYCLPRPPLRHDRPETARRKKRDYLFPGQTTYRGLALLPEARQDLRNRLRDLSSPSKRDRRALPQEKNLRHAQGSRVLARHRLNRPFVRPRPSSFPDSHLPSRGDTRGAFFLSLPTHIFCQKLIRNPSIQGKSSRKSGSSAPLSPIFASMETRRGP